MTILAAVLALFLATLFPSSDLAASQPPTAAAVRRGAVAPSWRVDLHSELGSRPLGAIITTPPHEHEAYPQTSVVFLDDHTVAATYVTRKNQKEDTLSKRKSGSDSSLQLHIFLLDAPSGKVIATASWPTASRFAGIVASHGGNFVVQRGTELTLSSPRLQEIKKLELPPPNNPLVRWNSYSSPTGENILFIATDVDKSSVPWIWIDTDSLRIIRMWRDNQNGDISISDNQISMLACLWSYNCDKSLQVRDLSISWKTILPIPQNLSPRLVFINDQTIFLYDDPSMELLLNGSTTDIEHLDGTKRCGWSLPVVSAGGQRFIVPSCKGIGDFPALDTTGTEVLNKIAVYDRPFRIPTYILKVKGPKLKDWTKMAVSPDGSKMAVLNKESIELFQLPPIR